MAASPPLTWIAKDGRRICRGRQPAYLPSMAAYGIGNDKAGRAEVIKVGRKPSSPLEKERKGG